MKEAKALSLIGFFAASVHPANGHVGRPERYTEDKSAFPGIQAMGRKTYFEYMKQIDAMYGQREWLSDKYSVLDPYASSSTCGACGANTRWRSSRTTALQGPHGEAPGRAARDGR